MPTEPHPAGDLDLESTAEMPAPTGQDRAEGSDSLARTDAWRIAAPLGEHRIGATEVLAPEQELQRLREDLQTLERELADRDASIAALQRELAGRERQCAALERQLAVQREQLLQSSALIERLRSREPARSAPAADAPRLNEEAAPQRLLVRTEGAHGIVHVLGRRTTVGRTTDNDLRVEADFVSRHHAVLLLAGTDTVLEDLHSTNGTFVNGEPIARRTLREGDLVTFGKIQFRFVTKPP